MPYKTFVCSFSPRYGREKPDKVQGWDRAEFINVFCQPNCADTEIQEWGQRRRPEARILRAEDFGAMGNEV